ncbi:hypothetical protein QC760_005419 [Botrytis cinerea]
MSKDNIQSGSAKSLGFGKAFVALSRTTVLTIASIKQKSRCNYFRSAQRGQGQKAAKSHPCKDSSKE